MGSLNMQCIFIAALAGLSIIGAMPGSPQEKDVHEPFVQQFLASTLTHTEAPPKGTDNELTTLVKVTKVTFQVVAGIKYTYDFEARGVKTHKLYTCSLVVISQPWAEGDVVDDYKCQPLSSNLLLGSVDSETGDVNGKPGASQEKDVHDTFVQQFLASTLTHTKAPPKGTDNELTTLVKVTKVTFQVVAGIKYTYDFEARGVKTHKLYTCSLVVVSQPWAQGDVVDDYKCQPLSSNLLLGSTPFDKEEELDNSKENYLFCPGCPQKKNVNDPMVTMFLASTLSQVKAPPKGTDNELTTLVRITKVTYQIVAGIKYTYDFEARGVKTHQLYTCSLSVVSRPWAEGESVQDFKCEPLYLRSTDSENAVPGAPQEKSVDDPFVQQFLASTLTHVKAPPKGTDNELTTLVQVTRVTYQVVSGIKYNYEFLAKGVKTHQLYTCHLSVLSRPWAEGDSVQDFQCNRLYLPSTNGLENPITLEIDNVEATTTLKDALDTYNAESTTKKYYLVQITKAQVQVVAGLQYTIDFEAKDETNAPYACEAVIIVRAWMANYSGPKFGEQYYKLEELDCLPQEK